MSKRNILLLAAFALATASTRAEGEVKIKVGNTLDFQRREIVAVNTADIYAKLGVADTTNLVVRNALGQEVASQQTYDHKLIIEASVRPHGEATYTVAVGTPSHYESYAYGQVWNERLDDLTWENDCAIYRFYGPALQRTGERSFGTDLWTKSTPYLDTQKRYKQEFSIRKDLNRLRKEKRWDEARALEATISYHLNHGTGYDAYGVGPTLGCGAPALVVDGQLKLPYCWQDCKILDNGPLRFTVLLTYGKDTIGKDTCVVEHRLLSLDKGSHFNEITVWYDGLSRDCQLASGVVVHSADTTNMLLGKDCALYADPTDRPEKISEQVYVGTLYTSDVKTKFLPTAENIKGVAGHAIGVVNYKPGSRFTYYFGSSWSGGDIRTWQEWQLRSRLYLETKRTPLTVAIDQ